MCDKERPARDPYAFSLGGLRTIASAVPMPVVPDRHPTDRQGEPDPKPRRRRFWAPAGLGVE
mgnify:FL=1